MWPFNSVYPSLCPEEVGWKLDDKASSQNGVMYDYIIVGGGTAGSVLASRLSENPYLSVLVLERGPVADTWANSVPLLSGSLGPESLAKMTKSAPLLHGDNRELILARGEGLGGGSRVNAMIVNRGTPADYNRWSEMGHPNWSYEKLLPYFVKSETCTGLASEFRGKNGPWVNRQFHQSLYRSLNVARTAAYRLGIPSVRDFNDPTASALCTWDIDVTEDSSYRRSSVFHAFLSRSVAVSRKNNLKICTQTLVTRLLTEPDGAGRLCATTVEFRSTDPKKGRYLFVAKARKEIILCCGAMGSPQVLMLSGIGPAEHLRAHGIEVVLDSPGVGSYLKDHFSVPLVWGAPLHDSLHLLMAKPWRAIIEIVKYVATGGGMLSDPWVSVAMFIPSKLISDSGTVTPNARPVDLDIHKPENIPDIEISPIPVRGIDNLIIPAGAFSFLVCLLTPKSMGTIRLKSGNAEDYALCDVGFMSNDADFAPMVKGVRLALHIADEMVAQGYPLDDGLALPASESTKDIERYIRQQARSTYHYSSSCRMAPFDDLESPGVVDDDLRVHGVDGLRVCDLSATPDIIAAHPMALAVAMAEKLADMLSSAHQHY